MMKKNKIAWLSMIVLVLLFSSSLVTAANIGVSPASVSFTNVLRNGFAERPINIVVDAPVDTQVTLTPTGEIADWLDFSERQLFISQNEPGRVIISVNPPADIPNGQYSGFVRINTSQLGRTVPNSATGLILPLLDMEVTVDITDNEILECSAKNFEITSAEEGEDLVFTATVDNRGNIRFWPEFTFNIWNQDSTALIDTISFSDQMVIPTQNEEIVIRIPTNNLDIGQYWVDVLAVQCFNEETLTFDVLEEGALRADGRMEDIVVQTWADIDEIVPITVSFRNTGEKPLDANFKGQITLNNKIVQLLESDASLFVPVGEEDAFTLFFTPRKSGRYVISGRIFYDSKRTYEKSAILNVNPRGVGATILRALLYTVLLIVIAILIYKIRKERRSYLARVRRLRG